MPGRQDIQVSLHIGAHKTATTHLQMCLNAARDDLLHDGVRYLGPQQLRKDAATLPAQLGLERPGNDNVDAATVATNVKNLTADVQRLVLSEENFIGTLVKEDVKIRRPIYPQAPERVSELAQVLAPKGIDVFLSIRNPAGYLNSAYSQFLRANGPAGAEEFKAANPIGIVNWAKFLKRFADVEGVRSLIVWPYEDYRELFTRIVSLMLGGQAAARVEWDDQTPNAGLSREAVRRVLSQDETSLRDDLMKVSEAQPKIDIHTGADHANSGMFYADQLEEIAAMRHVTLLRV